jgi:hypothetical protein
VAERTNGRGENSLATALGVELSEEILEALEANIGFAMDSAAALLRDLNASRIFRRQE